MIKRIIGRWLQASKFVLNDRGAIGTAMAIGLGLAGAGMGVSAYQRGKERKQAQSQYEQQMQQYGQITGPQLEMQEAYLPYYKEQIAAGRELLPWEQELYKAAMPLEREQIEAARAMLPFQRQAIEQYMPLYGEQIAQARAMLPYEREAMEAYMPLYQEQIEEARALLPYQREAMEKYYAPGMERLYGAITERPGALPEEEWARLWQTARERLRVGYGEAETALGVRAAGAGTMRGGPIQAEATRLDIARAEAETGLGMEQALRRYYEEQGLDQQYIENLFRFMGGQPGMTVPGAPAMGAMPGAPTMPATAGLPTMGAVGAPSLNLPGMPTAPAYEAADPYAMGKMAAMIPGMFPGTPSPTGPITGGVGGQTFTGTQIPGGTAWSPYSAPLATQLGGGKQYYTDLPWDLTVGGI